MFALGEKLKQHLLSSIPSAEPASGGKLVNCRCMECGDSNKSIKSKHMYIGMPTENDTGWYYCHKCNCKGILTYRKLIDWNVYDPELGDQLHQHNINVGRYSRYYTPEVGRIYNVRNTLIPSVYSYDDKIAYINNRLGTNLSINDMISLKIVLSLKNMLNENNITKYTRDPRIIDQLDRSFIGFLSLDNGFCTMRKYDNLPVSENIDMRYVNYRMFKKEDTTERFYVVPARINLLQPKRIKIHVAEGVFDILSIYLNLRNREPGIYATVSGSNYSSTISYFMLYKMIPNLELHLYPDNDQSKWKINKIVETYTSFCIPIYIHRNIMNGEKDFGVPVNRIKEAITKENYVL